jgi:hypothetical protein
MSDPTDPSAGNAAHDRGTTDTADALNHDLNDEDEDEDDVKELRELVETAAIEAIKDPLPHRAVDLARLDYLAQRPDGPACIYAMFMSWITSWKGMLNRVDPTLDVDDYWDAAQAHMLLPENGADPQARRLVGAFLLRELDEGLRAYVEADTDMAAESPDAFSFFYQRIYLAGAGTHRECALILLSMLKSAYYYTVVVPSASGARAARVVHPVDPPAPSE